MNDHLELSKSLNTMYHLKCFHVIFCICNDNNRCKHRPWNTRHIKKIDCAYIYEIQYFEY